MILSIRKRQVGHTSGLVIVEVAGEVDVHTAGQLQRGLVDAIDSGAAEVVVNLGGVTSCDGVGVDALVAAHRHAMQVKTKFCLVGTPDPVVRLLRAAGLHTILELTPTIGPGG